MRLKIKRAETTEEDYVRERLKSLAVSPARASRRKGLEPAKQFKQRMAQAVLFRDLKGFFARVQGALESRTDGPYGIVVITSNVTGQDRELFCFQVEPDEVREMCREAIQVSRAIEQEASEIEFDEDFDPDVA